jgi:copper resistance protein B
MNRLLILLSAVWLIAPAWAQHDGHRSEEMPSPATQQSENADAGHHTGNVAREGEEPADPHAGHDRQSRLPEDQEATDPLASHDMNRGLEPIGELPKDPPPPAAFSGPLHAADTLFDAEEMAQAREQLRAEEGGMLSSLVLADRFETRFGDGEERYLWDFQGWYGGDIKKLWLKSEGEGSMGSSLESAEFQALYSRAISPFFDVQAGIRHDIAPDPDRSHLVVGLQGWLPYVFEIDAAAFLSDKGDLTGRLEGEFDLQITQRLILQPRVEFNFAAQEVRELGIGSGIGSAEAGFRLRYEIRREFAPYVGLDWERKLGNTGVLARTSDADRESWGVVVGVRSWF